MRDLLNKLLRANVEKDVRRILRDASLWDDNAHWRWLGDTPNNQSVVHAQQSNAAAALVEKITNSIDAILIKRCLEEGIDPRGSGAPASMDDAIVKFFGNVDDPVAFAEANLMLIGTGEKQRLALSIFDNGEGQLAKDFPDTFCSLIHGHGKGTSNKGGIPFVQGRFNMGGTGILPYLGDEHHIQLIVSRRPASLVGGDDHEWAFTVFRFVADRWSPGWKYLTLADKSVPTAGSDPLALIPEAAARSGVVSDPYGREVDSGTLIKMFEYKGAKANICGDPLHPRLERFLLQARLPIRLVECRDERKAKVMRTTIWDTLGKWAQDKKALEPEFKDGASFSLTLETGEDVVGEIRVFKSEYGRKQGRPTKDDADKPVAGLKALINGQVHAGRDPVFFRSKDVNLEHIAGSLLVTLDCTALSASSRGRLFMANREHFREDSLLDDLFRRLKAELKTNKALQDLNQKRYEEKLATATKDEDGIKALEDLLASDPSLAALFGGLAAGRVAAPMDTPGSGEKVPGTPEPFVGQPYPTFFLAPDDSGTVKLDIPVGANRRPTWRTDVENNYLTRYRHRGRVRVLQDSMGLIQSHGSLHNGRFSMTLKAPKSSTAGTPYVVEVQVTDNAGSGPFTLKVEGSLVPPPPKPQPRNGKEREKPEPKVPSTPSSPNVVDVHDRTADDPPYTIEDDPKSGRLVLMYNVNCGMLAEAREQRPAGEEKAVDFVFKWGLALTCIGMIDAKKRAKKWDDPDAKQDVQDAVAALGRVVVPLCLALPAKLPDA